MATDDRNIPGEGEGGQAWHNALPAWITCDPAYQRLRQGPKHTMQTIADKCDQPPRDETREIIGSPALLVCIGGLRLIADCGCAPSTFWSHLRTLQARGYIVPLTNGGGRLASVYGIPGRHGELDAYRAKPGDKARRWKREDAPELRRLLSENRTLAQAKPTDPEPSGNRRAPLRKSEGTPPKTGRQPSGNRTLPSPLPSSCTSAHKPSPLGSSKESALLHDDDRGRSPDPNTGPLADQLSIRLPDGAGPDQVKAVLRDHGVDAGRAHKLALHPLTTPAMVRDVIARADGYRKANPGAYIGTMLDDAIVEARDAERERNAQAAEASQQRVADAEASIDTMTDAELEEAIESIGPLKGLSPATVRGDRAFRRELARYLSLHEVTVP